MIQAKDIMTTDVITFLPETEVTVAVRVLLEKHINGAPVVDENNNLVGILCQSDLVAQHKKMPIPTLLTLLDSYIHLGFSKQMEKQVRKIVALTVQEAMTPNPITVEPGSELQTVAALMVDNNFHTLPVVEGGKLVGIIGKEDVLRTLLP